MITRLKIYFSVLSLIIITVVQYGCGSIEDILEIAKDTPRHNITYLTQDLIDTGRASKDTYIVAFKTSSNKLLNYMNIAYRSELKTFYSDVYLKLIGSRGVVGINYLTSYDTTDNVEGLYYIDRKNPSVLEQLKNVDYIKDLTVEGYSPVDNMIKLKYSTKANYVALAEVKFENYQEANRIIDEWNQRGLIEYAEPNYLSRPFEGTYDDSTWGIIKKTYTQTFTSGATPYWYDKIKLLDAYTFLEGKSVTHPIVAVFDSGVDAEHPKLVNHMWHNPQKGVSNCGQDDEYGCNTTASIPGDLGDGSVYPIGSGGFGRTCSGNSCFHGTHVSGIVSSDFATDSGGLGGVCPVCRIMAIKITDSEATISDVAIIKGFKYISYIQSETNVNKIVRIVNASLGKADRSRSVGAMVNKMKETPKGKGVLVVAAAGNESTNMYTYMAAFKDTLSVSNIGDTSSYGGSCGSGSYDYDRKNQTSNYGKWVNIAAPGFCINSTVPGGGIEKRTGTSMAAPIVSGVAGLVISAYPNLSHSDLKYFLLVSANSDQLYKFNADYLMSVPGEDQKYPLLGVGVVDANLAVQKQASVGNLSYVDQNRFNSLCGTIRSIDIKSNTNNILNRYNLSLSLNLEYLLIIFPVFIAIILVFRMRTKKDMDL